MTRYPQNWRDMVQSSRMRGTLTSQSAVEPQERAIGGTEQLRRAHRPYACGIVLLDQGETTAKETAKLWGDLALIGPEKMMYKLSTEWS